MELPNRAVPFGETLNLVLDRDSPLLPYRATYVLLPASKPRWALVKARFFDGKRTWGRNIAAPGWACTDFEVTWHMPGSPPTLRTEIDLWS